VLKLKDGFRFGWPFSPYMWFYVAMVGIMLGLMYISRGSIPFSFFSWLAWFSLLLITFTAGPYTDLCVGAIMMAVLAEVVTDLFSLRKTAIGYMAGFWSVAIFSAVAVGVTALVIMAMSLRKIFSKEN